MSESRGLVDGFATFGIKSDGKAECLTDLGVLLRCGRVQDMLIAGVFLRYVMKRNFKQKTMNNLNRTTPFSVEKKTLNVKAT